VPLLSTGKYSATAIAVPINPQLIDMTFAISGGPKTVYAGSFVVNTATKHTVVVTTDPVKHLMAVQMDGVSRVAQTLTDRKVHVASITSHSQAGPNALLLQRVPTPRPTLCLSLIH
jgi:hypothetical protein